MRQFKNCIENVTKFDFTFLCCLVTLNQINFYILYGPLWVTTMELWYWISRSVLCCVENSNIFNIEITISYTSQFITYN